LYFLFDRVEDSTKVKDRLHDGAVLLLLKSADEINAPQYRQVDRQHSGR